MSETQEVFQVPGETLMTEQDLLFAQMRGILLHLDREMGYFGQWNTMQDGEDALKQFHIFAEEYGYQALQERFYQVPGGNEAFIAYWDSFQWPEVEQDDYEPDIDDSFPMSLEYPDEDPISPFDRDYYHYGEE